MPPKLVSIKFGIQSRSSSRAQPLGNLLSTHFSLAPTAMTLTCHASVFLKHSVSSPH